MTHCMALPCKPGCAMPISLLPKPSADERGVVDATLQWQVLLLTRHLYVTAPTCCTRVVQEMGATFQTVDIPEDMQEQAQEYHNKMIETVVEMDDDILEAYLEVSTKGTTGSEHIK